MLGALGIDLGIAVALLLLWYAWFVGCHRRKAAAILQRTKAALDGQARITGLSWTGHWRFAVTLKVLGGLFQRACIVVHLHPRPLPLNWLLSLLQKRRETLTFEADLEFPPTFNLQMHNQRWCAHTRNFSRQADGLQVEACTPLVITTRNDWQRDITNMAAALLSSRSCDLLSISFQRVSPHFSAVVLLDSFAPGAEMFESLRELASCALASRF